MTQVHSSTVIDAPPEVWAIIRDLAPKVPDQDSVDRSRATRTHRIHGEGGPAGVLIASLTLTGPKLGVTMDALLERVLDAHGGLDRWNPGATFDGYTPDTEWSLAQIAYFRSYATWH